MCEHFSRAVLFWLQRGLLGVNRAFSVWYPKDICCDEKQTNKQTLFTEAPPPFSPTLDTLMAIDTMVVPLKEKYC